MSFAEFKRQLLQCRDCRGLFGFEPRPLQWGEPSARVVIIGQAPSKASSECGRPFSRDLNTPNGSGARLMRWLRVEDETFYDPGKFYVAGVAHCYPGKGSSGDKRPPRSCADKWLAKELAYLKPRLFIVIGRYAADCISGHDRNLGSMSFEGLVFNDQLIGGRLAVFMPHPSGVNQKWTKDHPDFEASRIHQIRSHLSYVLTDISTRSP